MLDSDADLRAGYKQPTAAAVAKDIGHIDAHCRRFIELSPFLCIGTMSREGSGDVSPRGGEPGFVHVLDDKHLAMPDRPGNNRLDSLSNLVAQPGVGLMFMIPGFEDILRVNGVAHVTRDPELMARFVVGDKPPLSVIVIEVTQAYLHCTKAIRRARLWDPAARVDRGTYPSAGQILRDQLALDPEPAVIDAALEASARKTLY
jgi:PPOX class probable FMN-dependent enzyme